MESLNINGKGHEGNNSPLREVDATNHKAVVLTFMGDALMNQSQTVHPRPK